MSPARLTRDPQCRQADQSDMVIPGPPGIPGDGTSCIQKPFSTQALLEALHTALKARVSFPRSTGTYAPGYPGVAYLD
jgi:hypothetical protein